MNQNKNKRREFTNEEVQLFDLMLGQPQPVASSIKVLMEDILSPYCMLENNNDYLVGDSPDIWFYKCGIWTNESKDILDVITIWVAPNGLTVESTCGSLLCQHYPTMTPYCHWVFKFFVTEVP